MRNLSAARARFFRAARGRFSQRHDAPTELRFAVDGKRRILDLSPVRERLGSHWARYADSVFLVAEKVIRCELGPRDKLSRDGDNLIIVFKLPNTRASTVAQGKIAKALTQLLFGDGLVGNAMPPTRLAPPLRQSAPVRARGGLRRWLFRLFGRFRKSPASESAAAKPVGAVARSAQDDGARSVDAPISSRSDIEFVAHAPGAATGAPLRARALSSGVAAHRYAVPLARFAPGDDAEIRQIEWAIFEATLRVARANAEFGAVVEERLSHVRFAYRPLWHVASRALVCYRCTPVLVDDDDVIEGHGVLPNPMSVDQRMLLDQLALTNVIVDIEAMLKKNLDSVIIVPLHFTSFTADWSLGALSKLCGHIPMQGRKRLVIEINDAATGRTDARLPGVVRMLKPYCIRLGVIVPLRTRDMRYWSELGILTAAVDVGDWNGQEQDLVAELNRFVLGARRDGLKTAAFGLKTRSLILAAATMGFDFVQGAPISDLAAMGVMEQVPFDFADLYDA